MFDAQTDSKPQQDDVDPVTIGVSHVEWFKFSTHTTMGSNGSAPAPLPTAAAMTFVLSPLGTQRFSRRFNKM